VKKKKTIRGEITMSISLAELSKAFGPVSKTEKVQQEQRPNNYYPFWDMKDGEQAVVRFLPDADATNPFGFLVEKLMHNLEINADRKSTPCLRMYNEDCPICAVSQAHYKAEDKVNGKKYWRKKQHIAQALIVEDPMQDHQGKVRFLALGYQLFNIIKEAFEGGELENTPYDLDGGYDFVIKKTRQGEYSTYTVGSKFKNKPRSLTVDERTVAQAGSVDLKTLLPKNPGEDKTNELLSSATGE
jgi:hypothetical protein